MGQPVPERAELASLDEQEALRRRQGVAVPGVAMLDAAAAADAVRPAVESLGGGGFRSGGFPRGMGPAGFVAMQRLAGNRAVVGALGRASVQRVGLLEDFATPSDEETTGSGTDSTEKAPGPGRAGSAAGAPGGSTEPAGGPGSPGAGVLGGIGGVITAMGEGSAGAAGAEGVGSIAGQVAEAAGKLGGVDHGAETAGTGAHDVGEGLAGPGAEAAGAAAAHGVGEGSTGAAGAEGVGGIAGQVAEATGKLGGVDHGAETAGAGAHDAGEGLAGPGAAGSEEIPAVAEPGDVAVKEIADLGQKPPEVAAEEVKEPEAPEHEEPKNLEAGASDIERHAQGGGGGIVDVVINRALSVFRGIASTIGNGVRGAASAISSRVGGFFSQAFSFAKNVVTTVTSGARSIATGIATEIRTHLGSLKDGVKGIVSRVFGGVRNVMSQVGGAIRGAIIGILSGKPVVPTILAPFKAIFRSLFGGITGQITTIINRIRGVVDGAITRVLQTVVSLTQSIINGLTFLANLLTTAVTFLQQELTRLSNWVTQAVSGLPDMLRRVITAIVNAVISLARRVLNNIVTSARAFIARAIARVIAFVQRAMAIVTRIATAVRNTVRTVFDLVAAGVRAVATAFNRVKTWLLGKVAAFVSRVLRAVLDPIAERLKQRLLALIGPAAGEAIRQAQLLFPNGLPAPREVIQGAERGAQQVASEAGSAILAGLTNPEGDHIAFGIQLGGGGSIPGTPVGLSGSVSGMFDIVLDYRRNDIGFFLSPAAGGAASLGIGEGAAAGVGVSAAWGTVATFGEASSDVLAAYGGSFTNASYGVSGGVADEIGAEASTGGSIYRGGATPGIPVFSYTPLGADQHPVPGAIPGTPPTMAGQQHTFELGSLPDPLKARQTTGWDTTASVSGVVGAEAQAGLYGGLGLSYSIPLGKTHLDPATMHTIRILTGFMKLLGDVETLSPLGFIRDALGLSAAFPERDAVIERMTSVVTDWTIPLPPGSLVA